MPAPIQDQTTVPPPLRQPLRPRPAVAWLNDVAQAQQIPLGIATTVASLIIIGGLTMTPLGTEMPDHFDYCILCGRFGTADFILNVLLFIPLGFGLRLAGVRRRWAWLAAALLTAVIETLQYYVVPGRDSDLSGLVANSLGGAVGIALADVRRSLLVPSSKGARRLVGGWLLVSCGGAAGLTWAYTPDLPHTIYYEQIAPELGHFGLFDGTVYHPTFNGTAFRVGRLTPDSSAAMRSALLASGTTIAATIRRGTTPTKLAPIMSVFDRQRHEIFVFGQRLDDLVLRLRRKTDYFGFHTPSAVFPRALALDSAAETHAGDDTVGIEAVIEHGAVSLSVSGRGGATRRRVGFGIWDAWRLFVPDDGHFGTHDGLWLVVTMVALWFPLGYWVARIGKPRTMAAGPAAAAAAVAMVGTLAIIPGMAGAPTASPPVWAASLLGFGAAWTLSRWMSADPTTAGPGVPSLE